MTLGIGTAIGSLGLLLMALGVAAPAPTAPFERGAQRPRSALPACIVVRATARPTVGGYNHWVFIENDCKKPAACDVTTSVNPSTMTVAVKAGTTADVLTYRKSPERKFVPYVTCTLVGAR